MFRSQFLYWNILSPEQENLNVGFRSDQWPKVLIFIPVQKSNGFFPSPFKNPPKIKQKGIFLPSALCARYTCNQNFLHGNEKTQDPDTSWSSPLSIPRFANSIMPHRGSLFPVSRGGINLSPSFTVQKTSTHLEKQRIFPLPWNTDCTKPSLTQLNLLASLFWKPRKSNAVVCWVFG